MFISMFLFIAINKLTPFYKVTLFFTSHISVFLLLNNYNTINIVQNESNQCVHFVCKSNPHCRRSHEYEIMTITNHDFTVSWYYD